MSDFTLQVMQSSAKRLADGIKWIRITTPSAGTIYLMKDKTTPLPAEMVPVVKYAFEEAAILAAMSDEALKLVHNLKKTFGGSAELKPDLRL